jgi:ABC-2 type transport system ATP-binding protein
MATATGEPVIQLESVTKQYRLVRALTNVSLEIPAGVTGLLGPNGAGKSTLIKVLLGLVSVSAGTGRILGIKLGTQVKRIRAQVGYMPEDDCYIPGLSGVEMVRFVGRLSGIPSVEALRRAHEMLDFCGIEQERYRLVETYSTGMRQKLKFAQAIVHDPPLLILDEPTSGLDPRERQIMLRRIRTLADKHGKTVLISTHILPDVQLICDQVIILVQGQVRMSEKLEVLSRPVAPAYHVRVVGDAERLAARIRRDGLSVDQSNGGALTVHGLDANSSDRIWQWARDAGVGVRMFRPARVSLEQVFVDAVRETQHGST